MAIQVRPDWESTRKYLDYPSGKMEAWYILDLRGIDDVRPHVYCGFRAHVPATETGRLFLKIHEICDYTAAWRRPSWA